MTSGGLALQRDEAWSFVGDKGNKQWIWLSSTLTDNDITTTAPQSSGGGILIITAPTAQDAITLLQGDSDIISRSGAAAGCTLTFTRFFSDPTLLGDAIDFDGKDQVELNASGAPSSGTVTTPDTSFLQNGLADLPEGILNTKSLIANSCVARNADGSSSFNITGAGGLPDSPGNMTAEYPTGDVKPIPGTGDNWQPGDSIIEPQGIYELPNGELILSHGCQ